MIDVTDGLSLRDDEVTWTAIRSQGKGGQNVNKVSSAIQLRFDIPASSLPEELKSRLLKSNDTRISKDGVLIIKAQNHRTQERNKAEALQRLAAILESAARKPKKRRPTKPGRAAKQKRLDSKKRQSEKKSLRSKVSTD